MEDYVEGLRDAIFETSRFAHAGPRRLLDEALAKVNEVADLLERAEAAADHADAFTDSLSA